MGQHMVDDNGAPIMEENGVKLAIIGAGLLDKLGGYIPAFGYEILICYAPKGM